MNDEGSFKPTVGIAPPWRLTTSRRDVSMEPSPRQRCWNLWNRDGRMRMEAEQMREERDLVDLSVMKSLSSGASTVENNVVTHWGVASRGESKRLGTEGTCAKPRSTTPRGAVSQRHSEDP
jgi:hypothetical protein